MVKTSVYKRVVQPASILGLLGLMICGWMVVLSFATEPPHTLTIDNQSGQIAEVKVIGPHKQFIKVPLDLKRILRISPGTYYLLIRYGYSPKEYLYTKSLPFEVKEHQGQYSRITFTLHRIVSPEPNVFEVPSDEFESTPLTDSSP